jgi:hypothetical protein
MTGDKRQRPPVAGVCVDPDRQEDVFIKDRWRKTFA